MKRSNGVVVIAVAAALGVTTAVVAGGRVGRDALPTAQGAGAGTGAPASTRPATPTPSPTGPTSPTALPPTRTPSTTASRPPTTPPTTAPTLGPVTTAHLLRREDFAAAGWNTTSLTVTSIGGPDQAEVGMCAQSRLGSLEGAGAALRGDYVGIHTSAEEVAATFTSPAAADAAYATVRQWLADCRSGAFSVADAGTTVGPDVPLDLDDAHDTGVWATTAVKDGGTSGVMGVVLVSSRVAIFQVNDPDPHSTTINALMVAVAKRLSPQLTGS